MIKIAIGDEIVGPIIYLSDYNAMHSLLVQNKLSESAVYAWPVKDSYSSKAYTYAIWDKKKNSIVQYPTDDRVFAYDDNIYGSFPRSNGSSQFLTKTGWLTPGEKVKVEYTTAPSVKVNRFDVYRILPYMYLVDLSIEMVRSYTSDTFISSIKIDGKSFSMDGYGMANWEILYGMPISCKVNSLQYHHTETPTPSVGKNFTGTLVLFSNNY